MMVELTIRVFNLNREWVEAGKGDMFEHQEKVQVSTESKVLLGAIALAFFAPAASASPAIGAGVSEIVKKLCAAYQVSNATELARKYFKTDRATITNWEKQQSIPKKYIQRATNDTKMPISYFMADDAKMNLMRSHLIETIQEILIEGGCEEIQRSAIEAKLVSKTSDKINNDKSLTQK